MSFLSKIFGDSSERFVNSLKPTLEKINQLEPEYEKFKPEDFPQKTAEFKERLKKGETLDDILPETFALVREAAKRTLKQRHFDVQLLGGIVLHRGKISEMKTGEGKTLVATLPVYLNALSEKGAHIVTVNDYLARRDVVWMGPVYHLLGLKATCLNHETSYLYDPEFGKEVHKETEQPATAAFLVHHEFLKPISRREAYRADILYGTNNEFGFDYLRDNLVYRPEDMVQRTEEEGGFNFAVVDEIDSILIDESRTPLIISAPSEESGEFYKNFASVAERLEEGKDYNLDEKMRAVMIADEGIAKVEKILGVENIYTEKGIKYVHHIEQALRAKALFHRDKDYIIKEGEIMIVDEFTGRMMPGRRWSEGLHQAIEAKEGLAVERESRTVASITFQNYFRLYEKLSGMTGTALTSQEEFQKVYNLNVISVPTNRPLQRVDNDDFIFQTETGKLKALVRKVKELHEQGQPVLLGTTSIEKNELLYNYLRTKGIPHQILNAKNHEEEGEIIAQAGRRGAVTVATNMAGRGVDIVLGGNPLVEKEREDVLGFGGLFVIGTERHEARRIDNQLRGRAGRQGDPGKTQFYVSLEDSLMRVFASDTIKKMMGRFGIPEDEPIQNKLISRALENAQTKIEGFNFDARKHILEFDSVLNRKRRSMYETRRGVLLGEQSAVEAFLAETTEMFPEVTEMIEKKKEEIGESLFYTVAGTIILRMMDMHWMEHLEAMDYLRSSVNLRAYGQRDPLVEYKKEGLQLFKDMKVSLHHYVKEALPSIEKKYSPAEKKEKDSSPIGKNLQTNENVIVGTQNAKSIPAKGEEKVGRNDPCPCGAKKADGTLYKYKHCGLIDAPYHRSL